MRLALLPLIASPLLVGILPVSDDPPRFERAPLRRLVRFEDTLRNETQATLRQVRCDVLLPEDGPGQRVRWLRLSDHAWTLTQRARGQWCASAVVASLEPGDAVTFAWLAAVELTGAESWNVARLSARDRIAFLADDPALLLDDPAIVSAAAAVRAAAPSAEPEALTSAALDHVRENVRYELDGGWRPAPEVLTDGAGSCSETVFAFVAICRRLGVPARWVGGTLQRSGHSGRAVDTTFHRLAEVWLPGRGWVRVETTAGPRDDDERRLGVLPRAMLVLAVGGTSDSPAGLYYHARNEWSAPRGSGARPLASKRAYWVLDADRMAGDVDPLAGLRRGDYPSFARCEVALADAEGFGAPLPPGHVGAWSGQASARGGARPVPGDAASWLLKAGHPAGLRRAAYDAWREPELAPRLVELARDVCDGELLAAWAPLLGRPPADIEAWWAASGARMAVRRPGELTPTCRR